VERESAWNTIFYLLAAFPASLSMIYKERTIREQPMDMVYLNAWVSVYQFIGGLLLAPLVFDAEVGLLTYLCPWAFDFRIVIFNAGFSYSSFFTLSKK
jgi:hypothetical protein